MAKFRKNKFFKKQQSENNPEQTKKFEPKTPETVVVKKSGSAHESTTNSWIKSGTKYVYIIIAAALLSGVFTPFTIGVEGETVVYGMLILFIGVGGGVLIFKGVKAEKTSTILVCVGLSVMTISLVLIFLILSIIR